MGLLPDAQTCGLCMRWECRERFPRQRLRRKPLVSDSRHTSRHVSRWLTRGGGENVPGIPGACATRSFTYLVRGPLSPYHYKIIKITSFHVTEHLFRHILLKSVPCPISKYSLRRGATRVPVASYVVASNSYMDYPCVRGYTGRQGLHTITYAGLEVDYFLHPAVPVYEYHIFIFICMVVFHKIDTNRNLKYDCACNIYMTLAYYWS